MYVSRKFNCNDTTYIRTIMHMIIIVSRCWINLFERFWRELNSFIIFMSFFCSRLFATLAIHTTSSRVQMYWTIGGRCGVLVYFSSRFTIKSAWWINNSKKMILARLVLPKEAALVTWKMRPLVWRCCRCAFFVHTHESMRKWCFTSR